MVDETKIDGIPVYEIYKNRSLQDMTGEEWKDIEGYEGLYMVSNYGRVKSLKFGKERILYQSIGTKDYLLVKLFKEGNKITFRVHRLVAIAFIPNPENKPEVNHISELLYDEEHKDLAKKDNRSVNLEYCDAKYNSNYGTRNERISKSMLGVNINREDQSTKIICVETNKIYPSVHEAGRQTGIDNGSIIKCCKGKRKTAGGYRWKYATQE